MQINENIIICNYELQIVNKSNYHSEILVKLVTRDNILSKLGNSGIATYLLYAMYMPCLYFLNRSSRFLEETTFKYNKFA